MLTLEVEASWLPWVQTVIPVIFFITFLTLSERGYYHLLNKKLSLRRYAIYTAIQAFLFLVAIFLAGVRPSLG